MTPPHCVLGVDPASSGGVVLLDGEGRSALGAWGWHPVQRQRQCRYLLRSACGDADERVTLHEVSLDIADRIIALGLEPVRLVVEALFPGRNPVSTITLAEDLGRVVGPLEDLADGPTVRVPATTWRSVVLGRQRWTSAAAERAARALCEARWRGGLGELVGDPHVCEAACIAWYGVVAQRGEA